MTPLQKQCRVQFSGENFRLYEAHPETFLSTDDEMWILHRHPKKNNAPCNGHNSFVYSPKVLNRTKSWKDHSCGVFSFGGTFACGLHSTQDSKEELIECNLNS
jgi:hypothetical protein